MKNEVKCHESLFIESLVDVFFNFYTMILLSMILGEFTYIIFGIMVFLDRFHCRIN